MPGGRDGTLEKINVHDGKRILELCLLCQQLQKINLPFLHYMESYPWIR